MSDAEEDEAPGDRDAYRTVFFLGAGASVAAGVPATVGLVTAFESFLAEGHPELRVSLDQLLLPLRKWAEEKKKLADIELLYQVLVDLAEPEPGFLLERLPADLRVLSRERAGRLHGRLEYFIRKATFVTQEVVDYLEPLWHFLTPGRPLEIYSTNYDTCIEQVCERMRLRWQDGFELHWEPGVLGRATDEVNLRKLHGSVLWVQDEEGTYFRVPLRPAPDQPDSTNQPNALMGLAGPCFPLIAYPGRKQSYEAPFVDSLVALQDSLGGSQDRVLLVVIGYSFRDDHLLQILFDSSSRNRHLRVVLVDPDAEKIYQERLRVISRHGKTRVSPLAGRVWRLNVPVERRLRVFDNLRAQMEIYEYALWAEERQRSHTPSGASTWQGVAQEFFKAGDLPSVYRYGPKIGWTGWQEHAEYYAQVKGVLAELELLILSKGRPPEARRLEREVSTLCERPSNACMVLANGEFYQLSLQNIADLGVSSSALTSILGKACRRCKSLGNHPGIGRKSSRGLALRRMALLLRQALRSLAMVIESEKRGLVSEEVLAALAPEAIGEIRKAFEDKRVSRELAGAWQERIKMNIAKWGTAFQDFVATQEWAEYDL